MVKLDGACVMIPRKSVNIIGLSGASDNAAQMYL